MSDILLSLSTKIREPKKFLVDNEEYDILGLDHLNPAEEAEVVALFARYGVLNDELSVESNVNKGKVVAERMRDTRLSIISKLTTLPKEVVKKLSVSAQAQLLEAVRTEVEAEPEEDEDAVDERAPVAAAAHSE